MRFGSVKTDSFADLRMAAVATLPAIGGFVSSYEIGRRAGLGADLGILTTVLVITLARRPHAFDSIAATLREFVVLAGVGIAANAVAFLFAFSYAVGAATFTVGMFTAVWLRQFGAFAREAGAMLMLPLVALLIVPAPHLAEANPWLRMAYAILAGAIALFWVRLTQFSAVRLGVLPRAASPATRWSGETHVTRPGRRISVTTQFAVQMAVALGAAFALGRVFFAAHAGWVVTTAFIVCIGNRGRGDVAYKSVLRIAGALAGTVLAFAAAELAIPNGPITVALVFAALFFGTWLRRRSYAYWALAITLVLAMLQRTATSSDASASALELRVLAILMGALCGTAASWFVMPIRTERVAMRRLAEMLAALSDVLKSARAADDVRADAVTALAFRVERLTEVAPPLDFHRRLIRAKPHVEHPANWIAVARDCAPLAVSFAGPPGDALRASEAARKTLGALARSQSVAPEISEQRSLVDVLVGLREALAADQGRA